MTNFTKVTLFILDSLANAFLLFGCFMATNGVASGNFSYILYFPASLVLCIGIGSAAIYVEEQASKKERDCDAD